MNVKSFHLSVQGTSHIKIDKECQDTSACFFDEDGVIAVVCDGHGGSNYVRSALGSKFGCEAAQKNIREFISGVDSESFFEDPDEKLRRLEASIINSWNEAVFAHYSNTPFTEEELHSVSEKARRRYEEGRKIEKAYGTTLIAVAVTKEYWFGIHIGDGKCVAVSREGEFSQPIPWDPKCFLTMTTSISGSDAIGDFRHFYSKELPAAVFVGSDGIDDSFQNDEQMYQLYKTTLYSISTSEFDQAIEELKEYLPRLSAQGSGDDVSIAGILDMEVVPELEIVRNFGEELAKEQKEEVARESEIEAEETEVESEASGSGEDTVVSTKELEESDPAIQNENLTEEGGETTEVAQESNN